MLIYINKVQIARAIHMRNAVFAPEARIVQTTALIPWRDICAAGLSSVSERWSVEEGVRTCETTLTAVLEECADLPREPLAFRLTATDGTVWLLGDERKPFPVVTQNASHPDRVSSVSAVTLTATMNASHGLLAITSET